METPRFSHPPADLGDQLARLRKQASKTQAGVSAVLGVDSSKISRIEDGKIVPSLEDVDTIIDSLGPTGAEQFRRCLGIAWRFLKRPPFDHPDIEHLEAAECTLQRIESFCAQNPSPALTAQASTHMEGLKRAAG